MKKILFFTDTPLLGGAELQMFLLAKFLKKEKYRVFLACLSNPSLDHWCKQFEDAGIKVFRIPSRQKNHPKIFFVLRKILREEKIDLIHIHLWNPASGRSAFLAARNCHVPYIVTEHDPFRLNPLKRGLKRFLIKKPSGVIAISKENQEFLKQEYRGKLQNIHWIPNGIDIEAWKNETEKLSDIDRRKVREEIFQARENDFVITNIATLHERKGQETLLKGFALLLKKDFRHSPEQLSPVFAGTPSLRSGVRLVLVGDGEYRQKFERLTQDLKLQDKVKFLGHRNDVMRLLPASDLFVLPSHREGFGLAILEAAMAKLPVVASNIGGIPDIIEDGKDGILVPPRNPEALADAMKDLIQEPEKCLAFGSALHEKVMSRFHAKMMAEKTEALYDSILRNV